MNLSKTNQAPFVNIYKMILITSDIDPEGDVNFSNLIFSSTFIETSMIKRHALNN